MMANARLAISCPQVGIRSETFIRRHIEDLSPGSVVVIANKPTPISQETWSVDCPVYRANNARSTVSQQVREGFFSLMGKETKTTADRRGILKFLKDHQVGVLLAEYLDDAWPLLGIARDLNIRFFAHAHGYDLSSLYRVPLWRRRYAEFDRADGVIVVNRVMRERLVSLGVRASKIHIIPCGVDVPVRSVKRPRDGRVRCLAVGRMVPKKGPLKLLEAFRDASKNCEGLSLDYIGTGPMQSEVCSYIADAGLTARVTLHGGQPHQAVMQFMERADLFLQHSMVDPMTGDEEGMPVAIQEAMAHGLPVIATCHAGIPDAVLSGTTGFLVAEGDAAGMAAHIVSLAKSPQLRETIGAAARQRAREHFSWDRERSALLEILVP